MYEIGEPGGLAPSEPSNEASPKAKIPPSEATIQYPRPSWVGAMPMMGWLRWCPPHRALEAGIAVGKDPAVGGHHPVPASVVCGRHADDRLVEVKGAGRAPEPGVAEREDTAVRSVEPIAAAIGRGFHADHVLVQDGA